MPEGVIVGGWGFVAAAYLVTAVGLFGYGVGLWWRLRDAGRPAEDESAEENR